jgi:hypothetical protein
VIRACASASLTFSAPPTRPASWPRSMDPPLAAVRVRVIHCGSVRPVPASCLCRMALRVFSAWPMTCVLNGGWLDTADDRRRNVITITPAGTAHLYRLDGLLASVQDELLAPLSPAERAQLIRLLTRVLEHHSTA